MPLTDNIQRYRNIHLAIMAIEGAAALMNLSGSEMYERLKKQNLVHGYLLKYYEELHTQSKEWLAETTVEALNNWEAAR